MGDIRRQDPETGGHKRGQPRATGAVGGWVDLGALDVNNQEAGVVEDLTEEEQCDGTPNAVRHWRRVG